MVGSFEDGAQGPQLLIYTPLCNLLSSVCWTKWPTPNEQKSDGMPLLRLHYKNKKFTQGTMVGCWPRANTKNWDVQPATEKELNAANTRVRELEADLPQGLQMRPQPWWTGWMLNWDPEPEHPAGLYSDSWSTKDNICCFKPLKFWGNLSYSASGWTVSPSKFRC